jgi:hypothetical protein
MIMFAPLISTSFVRQRYGSMTCAMITIYFLIGMPFIGLTGYILTKLVVVVVF